MPVVIGIILGTAVKGKALVDAARVKAEVAKLNKFEAAAYTYNALTGKIPLGDTANSNVIDFKKFFFDRGLLNLSDNKSELLGDNINWGF